jgi:hypothetical protein
LALGDDEVAPDAFVAEFNKATEAVLSQKLSGLVVRARFSSDALLPKRSKHRIDATAWIASDTAWLVEANSVGSGSGAKETKSSEVRLRRDAVSATIRSDGDRQHAYTEARSDGFAPGSNAARGFENYVSKIVFGAYWGTMFSYLDVVGKDRGFKVKRVARLPGRESHYAMHFDYSQLVGQRAGKELRNEFSGMVTMDAGNRYAMLREELWASNAVSERSVRDISYGGAEVGVLKVPTRVSTDAPGIFSSLIDEVSVSSAPVELADISFRRYGVPETFTASRRTGRWVYWLLAPAAAAVAVAGMALWMRRRQTRTVA